MECYENEEKNYIIEIDMDEETAKLVKVAINAFTAGINNAPMSVDQKESEKARYIATTFLEDEKSREVAKKSYWKFMYQLEEKLGLH